MAGTSLLLPPGAENFSYVTLAHSVTTLIKNNCYSTGSIARAATCRVRLRMSTACPILFPIQTDTETHPAVQTDRRTDGHQTDALCLLPVLDAVSIITLGSLADARVLYGFGQTAVCCISFSLHSIVLTLWHYPGPDLREGKLGSCPWPPQLGGGSTKTVKKIIT